MGLNAGNMKLYFVINDVDNYICNVYICIGGGKTLSRQR